MAGDDDDDVRDEEDGRSIGLRAKLDQVGQCCRGVESEGQLARRVIIIHLDWLIRWWMGLVWEPSGEPYEM